HFFVLIFFFFQAEDGIRDATVTGVQTCALPILLSTNGYTHLGGDDIDNLLQALFHEKILQQHRVDFSPRAELAQELRTALIRVKIGRASCRERGEIEVGVSVVVREK